MNNENSLCKFLMVSGHYNNNFFEIYVLLLPKVINLIEFMYLGATLEATSELANHLIEKS